jgi:hypothetical protein
LFSPFGYCTNDCQSLHFFYPDLHLILVSDRCSLCTAWLLLNSLLNCWMFFYVLGTISVVAPPPHPLPGAIPGMPPMNFPPPPPSSFPKPPQ